MTAAKAVAVNKYGVKVGDVFYNSWGYEQTNIDFYEVVKLRGKTQIVLRAIASEVVEVLGFCSTKVKPVKGSWTKHYLGEEVVKTVKEFDYCGKKEIYCNADHGLLYKTDWNKTYNETSYY